MKLQRPSSPHESVHIHAEAMRRIRALPGNNQCCDCAGYHDIQWSSVSHGILLCLDCAGKHRSLGVQVSVIKSLQMDEWEPIQLEYLFESGNSRFKDTVRQLDQSLEFNGFHSVTTVYLSHAVAAYRTRLHKHIKSLTIRTSEQKKGDFENEEEFNNEVNVVDVVWPWDKLSTSISSESTQLHTLSTIEKSSDECNGSSSGAGNDSNSTNRDCTPSSSLDLNDVNMTTFTVTFPNGVNPHASPLGMTLTKESGSGRAFVSKLVRGGAAHLLGVRVQDYIQEVNSVRTDSYLETMQCIQSAACSSSATVPITFTLSRSVNARSGSACIGQDHELFVPQKEEQEVVEETMNNIAESLHTSHISSIEDVVIAVSKGDSDSDIDRAPICSRSEITPNHMVSLMGVSSEDFRVVFPCAPLGITVVRDGFGGTGRNVDNHALIAPVKVNRVIEGSQAEAMGIRIGDHVIGINGQWIAGYEDFITQVKASRFPMTLIMRRQQTAVLSSSPTPLPPT